MTENPEAGQGPSGPEEVGDPADVAVAPPPRNAMPWLLVSVLVVLAAVLVFAVVMVVGMLS